VAEKKNASAPLLRCGAEGQVQGTEPEKTVGKEKFEDSPGFTSVLKDWVNP